jgi:hypothetical protein
VAASSSTNQAARAAPIELRAPQAQLRRAAVLAVERAVEHRDVVAPEREGELRAELEVARHDRILRADLPRSQAAASFQPAKSLG